MSNPHPSRAGASNIVRSEVADAKTRLRMVRAAAKVLVPQDCEDAAHDAVVQALAHADGFRADAQVGTWLFRITYNTALVRLRGERRSHQRLQRAEREAGALRGRDETGLAAAQFETEELRAALRAAVDRLAPAYRTALERCVYDEQNPEMVAAQLGITASALRTRISRARDQLRAEMAAQAKPRSAGLPGRRAA